MKNAGDTAYRRKRAVIAGARWSQPWLSRIRKEHLKRVYENLNQEGCRARDHALNSTGQPVVSWLPHRPGLFSRRSVTSCPSRPAQFDCPGSHSPTAGQPMSTTAVPPVYPRPLAPTPPTSTLHRHNVPIPRTQPPLHLPRGDGESADHMPAAVCLRQEATNGTRESRWFRDENLPQDLGRTSETR